MNVDFEDILDYLRGKPSAGLAVVVIVLLLIGYLIFTFGTLLPRWRQHAELTAASATAEAASEARTAQLVTQTGAAQATFDAMANRFLTEAQAAAFLNGLYDSAAETAVTIVSLQAKAVAQSVTVAGEKPAYDTRQFRLVAEGDLAQLNEFVGRVEETAVPGIVLDNLLITQGGGGTADRLTLDLLLYTSPFSTGESVAELPEPLATPEATQSPLPSPTPTILPTSTPDVTALVAQLDAPWAAENWPEVIRLIQEIRQLVPTEAGMMEKLYAARVNFGYQLAELGDTVAAVEQFEQALAIFPQGTEAEAGLQSLFDPTATPTPETTVYVVQRGDTLFSIARRFGSTVDAVKAANNLMSNNITPGQQLIIP